MKKNSFKDFVSKQNFIKDLSIPEHIIMGFGLTVGLTIFIVQICLFKMAAVKDGTVWLTLVASLLSVMFSFAGSKRRIVCPLFGLVASIFLMATSGGKGLYGFVIMQGVNAITQVLSLIFGYKNSSNKISIEPKTASGGMITIYCAFFFGISFLYAGMEGQPGFYGPMSDWTQEKANPYYIRILESFSLMLAVASVFPMVTGYKFFWGLYLVCDITMGLTGVFTATINKGEGGLEQAFNCGSTFSSNMSMLAGCIIAIINGNRHTKKHEKRK